MGFELTTFRSANDRYLSLHTAILFIYALLIVLNCKTVNSEFTIHFRYSYCFFNLWDLLTAKTYLAQMGARTK